MKLESLQYATHQRLLALRSIEYLINTPLFARLWADSIDSAKMVVRHFITNLRRESLLKWMANHPSIDIGEMSIARIKQIAKDLRIKNYSRLRKTELINAIEGLTK